MADEFVINIKLDGDAGPIEQKINEVQQRADKGVNVPINSGQPGTFARPGTASPITAMNQQAVIDAATRAGEAAAAQAGYQQYASPIGPALLPGGFVRGAQSPEQAQAQLADEGRDAYVRSMMDRTQEYNRNAGRVDRSFDAAGLAQQKRAEQNARRVDDSWDRAALAQQKAAEAAERKAQELAEEAENEPGPLSRIANMRVGRGVMFGAIALDRAFTAVHEYQDYQTNLLLNGGNQAGQLAETLRYRQQLIGSVPFVGSILGQVQDPGGSVMEGIRLSQQQVTTSDQQMALRQATDDYQRNLSQHLSIAQASGTGKIRAAADAELVNTKEKSRRLFDQEQSANDAFIAQTRAEQDATRDQRAHDYYARLDPNSDEAKALGDGVNVYQKLIPGMEQKENTALYQDKVRRDALIKGKRDAANKTAQQIYDETTSDADVEDAYGGGISLLRASGQAYSANFNEIMKQSRLGNFNGRRTTQEIEALSVSDHRDYIINSTRMQGETAAARLAMEGSPRASALRRIDAGYDTAVAGLDISALDYQKRIQDLRDAATVQYQEANRDEARRLNAYQSSHEAAGYSLNHQPLQARLASIIGERARAMMGPNGRDITDPAEIQRINERAQDEVAAAVQGRREDVINIDINQNARAEQLKALLDRDPERAAMKGIVGQARAEEARDRQLGFNDQADRALRLGVDALKLERQNYRESFEAVPVSNDFALAMGMLPDAIANKYKEKDPTEVMKEFKGEIAGLGAPGGTTDIPQLLKDIAQAVSSGWDKLSGKIQN